MKNLLPFCLLFLGITTLWAQQPVFAPAEISDARVYYNGVELSQKAKLQLPKGSSEIVITNIANQVQQNSIRIGTKAPATILSVQYSNSYIEEYDNADNSPLTQPLKDSIAEVELKLNQLNNEISTDKQTIELLDANTKAGEKSVQFSTVNEMSRWIDFYQTKRQALQNGLFKKEKNKDKLVRHLNELKAKLQLGTDPTVKSAQGKLIVRLMTDKAVTADFDISYISPSANWTPSYDLEIEEINQPIQTTYKAEVSQTTGMDWKDIHLSLTSGIIGQNRNIPQLNNWFIRYQSPMLKADYEVAPRQELAYAAMNKRTTSSDNTLAEHTILQENQLNMSFDIQVPYTVLTNGKAHSVAINSFDLEGDFQYYAVPKLDNNAYLIASVKDYSDRHLLPGNANMIFDHMHIGKTYLSTDNTDEELKLNLGRDPQVSIDRKLISDKSGTKFLSSKKEQSFTYEITIRNNKTRKVDLKMEDQFPLSTDKSIEVELKQTSGAKIDEEKGLLSWDLNLKPGETKTIKLSYLVKSDKDKKISNL